MKEALLDKWGRRITTLRISVIDRCNLRCIYCVPPTGLPKAPRRELLTYEEITQVAAAAVELGIRHIKLTGGEPLLRRNIVRLVEMLGEIEELEDLSLTTNGTLLGPLAGDLKRAGLRRVTVSLDTLQPKRFAGLTGTGEEGGRVPRWRRCLPASRPPRRRGWVPSRSTS